MFELVNEATGKSLKVSNRAAREVFGLKGSATSLVCLPSAMPMQKLPMGPDPIVVRKGKWRRKKIGGTCVVRMGGLGDLVILTSTLAKLKRKRRQEPLTLATIPRHVELFKGLSCLDHCIPIQDLGCFSFDLVIDLRHAVEPGNVGPGKAMWRDYVTKDRSDMFDAICGVNSSWKPFRVPVDPEAKKRMREFLGHRTDGPIVAVAPTTISPVRVIPPEYVVPLVKKVKREIGGTVLLLGKTEYWNEFLAGFSSKNGVVNLINKTSEKELITAAFLADAVITPDSGMLHIAAALKKKTLALFGNIDPRTRTLYYPTVTALYHEKKPDCVPCWDVPFACDIGKPGAPCMRKYTPETIVRELKRMLS